MWSFNEITQVVTSDTCFDQASRAVMNVAEEQVRFALIKMGWTPPSAESKVVSKGKSSTYIRVANTTIH